MPVFQILLTLADGPRDASAILEALQSLDDRSRLPSMASFYRNLKRATDDGWLAIVDDVSAARTPGRPGQSYRITDSGRAAVRLEATRLHDLATRALSGGSVPATGPADV